MTCPHANIVHCPLYIESHNGRGIGCSGGEADRPCLVKAGRKNYTAELSRLVTVDARLVAECAWHEDTDNGRIYSDGTAH
jgi:hypothetical protein